MVYIATMVLDHGRNGHKMENEVFTMAKLIFVLGVAGYFVFYSLMLLAHWLLTII